MINCKLLLIASILFTASSRFSSFLTAASNPSSTSLDSYQILSEEVVYDRWRRVIQRKVRMPKGQEVDYDVIDQKDGGAAVIFAWDSSTKTATIVREYNPGCHEILGGLAAGLIENEKHNGDPLIAARHELEEECHLGGGKWYRLTKPGVAIAMDKYVQTKITPFLVIDAHKVENPRPLDDEEDIEIVTGVTVDEIRDMIARGDMNLVGSWASLLALQKLRDLGEIS